MESLKAQQLKVKSRPAGKRKAIRRRFGKKDALHLSSSASKEFLKIRESLNDKDKLLAELSSQAYNHARGEKDQLIAGYRLVDHLSGDEHVVYRNDNDRHTVISYRGTDPTKIGDLVADAHIATGYEGLSPRFRRALETYNKVSNQMKGDNFTLTGHSLGGALANWVSDQTGTHATTFNPGVGKAALIPPFVTNRQKGTKKIIRVNKDPVSQAIMLRNAIYNDPDTEIVNVGQALGVLNSHSIDNFTS